MKVLAVFLLMAFAVLGQEFEEDAEMIPITTTEKTKSKKYYPEFSKKLNWEQALVECRTRSMTLVSINSQEEQEEIIKVVKEGKKPYSAFWTAGTVRGESELYFWNTTGEALTYSNWQEGEPNPFDKFRCILVNSGGKPKWMFHDCTATEFFICKQ